MKEITAHCISDVIGKMLSSEMSQVEVSKWAWERHWEYEKGVVRLESGKEAVLFQIITALALGGGEGCEVTNDELREMLTKLD